MRSHARGLTHGVADGLEEEQEEQANGPTDSGRECGEDREHGAHHAVYREQQGWVNPVQQHDAYEAACRERDLAIRVELTRERLADPDVLVEKIVDRHGGNADLGSAGR